jgi:hypothetical protein
MRTVLLALALWAVMPALGRSEPFPPRLYQITTETGLPHLEENLRYATTRSTACLGARQLASAFPILRHEALQGCRLDHKLNEGETTTFALTCSGGNETTGSATWHLDERTIYGTLDVRLGGKNMTFYQRISGRSIGSCDAGD